MKRSIKWLEFRAWLSSWIPFYAAKMRGGLYDGDIRLPSDCKVILDGTVTVTGIRMEYDTRIFGEHP